MLVYHPAFDSYHCLFRSIAILEVCSTIEVERLRILDFCLSFPMIVSKFRLPTGWASVKKAALITSSPYRDPISARSVFINLATIQMAAFSCLTATGLITVEGGVISRAESSLPDLIKRRCLEIQQEEKVFFEILLPQLMALPLLGADGLKARSGLMEYKYDTI